MINLCVNCSHFELHIDSNDPELGLCKRLQPVLSLVTGKTLRTKNTWASVERLSVDPNACGNDSQFFSPKLEVPNV